MMSPDSKACVEALHYFHIMGQSRSYDMHIQSQSEMIKVLLCKDQSISISFRHTNPKVTWKNTIMSIILVVSWVRDKSKNTIGAQSIQSRLYTNERGKKCIISTLVTIIYLSCSNEMIKELNGKLYSKPVPRAKNDKHWLVSLSKIYGSIERNPNLYSI